VHLVTEFVAIIAVNLVPLLKSETCSTNKSQVALGTHIFYLIMGWLPMIPKFVMDNFNNLA
jgi:hypothetical protein